jgi:hypothetical protein
MPAPLSPWEVIVERDQIAPVRVVLKFFPAAENRSSPNLP